MTRASLRGGIELVSNILIICALAAAALIYFGGRSGANPTPNGFRRGESLPRISDLTLRAPKTVILVLSTGCHYCQVSKPFYKSLLERTRGRSSVDMIALFPEGRQAASEFLSSSQLDLPVHAGVSLRQLRIQGTPAILVVDNTGKVIELWTGQLSSVSEERVRETIFGRTGA